MIMQWVPKAHRAVQICLDRIDDLRTTYPAGYYLGIKGWLYQLFFILESEILAPDKIREITTYDLPQQKNSAVSSRKNGYFKENTKEKLCLITDYIANYYPQKISIEQIAAVCGFSSSHFMKFFKLYMGKPFIAYLNEYRLIRAAHMCLLYNRTAFFSDFYTHTVLTSAPFFIVLCRHVKQGIYNRRRYITAAFSSFCHNIGQRAVYDFFLCFNDIYKTHRYTDNQ